MGRRWKGRAANTGLSPPQSGVTRLKGMPRWLVVCTPPEEAPLPVPEAPRPILKWTLPSPADRPVQPRYYPFHLAYEFDPGMAGHHFIEDPVYTQPGWDWKVWRGIRGTAGPAPATPAAAEGGRTERDTDTGLEASKHASPPTPPRAASPTPTDQDDESMGDPSREDPETPANH